MVLPMQRATNWAVGEDGLANAGEGFTKSAAEAVAPVGIEFAGFLEHLTVVSLEWSVAKARRMRQSPLDTWPTLQSSQLERVLAVRDTYNPLL